MQALLCRLVAAFLLMTFAPPALAADGVLEINQACAVETGCFPGDPAGFPVVLDEPGASYRLTSRLVVPDENTDAILVTVANVSVDLGGFSILRSGCEDSSVSCTAASGSGDGVRVSIGSIPGLSVRNGNVVGMGAYGVFGGHQSEVRNVRVRWNRLDGVSVEHSSVVSHVTARENGADGISASVGSVVVDSSASLNVGDGISVQSGVTVSRNASYENDGDGIQTFNGCMIQGNSVRFNGGFGLNLSGTQSAYRENVISGNTGGTVSAAGDVNLGGNACNGTTTCP